MLLRKDKYQAEKLASGVTTESALTSDLRNKVDDIWDSFWTNGISNPLIDR